MEVANHNLEEMLILLVWVVPVAMFIQLLAFLPWLAHLLTTEWIYNKNESCLNILAKNVPTQS